MCEKRPGSFRQKKKSVKLSEVVYLIGLVCLFLFLFVTFHQMRTVQGGSELWESKNGISLIALLFS